MSDDILVTIAEQVTAELAAASLPMQIEPERSYKHWEHPLAEMRCLSVEVAPSAAEVEIELVDQESVQYRVPIDIAVRYRFSKDQRRAGDGRIEPSEIDRLVQLTLAIAKYFVTDRFENFEAAVWTNTEILAAFVPKQLEVHGQYMGVVRLTFEADELLP